MSKKQINDNIKINVSIRKYTDCLTKSKQRGAVVDIFYKDGDDKTMIALKLETFNEIVKFVEEQKVINLLYG